MNPKNKDIKKIVGEKNVVRKNFTEIKCSSKKISSEKVYINWKTF